MIIGTCVMSSSVGFRVTRAKNRPLPQGYRNCIPRVTVACINCHNKKMAILRLCLSEACYVHLVT